jgi:hypothetical protein
MSLLILIAEGAVGMHPIYEYCLVFLDERRKHLEPI